MSSQKRLKAILVDLSGTLHVDDDPTENAVAALQKLRENYGIVVRFVTNTTKESKSSLLARLHRIGFSCITRNEVFSSLSAAARYVHENSLNPYYLLSEDAKKDFTNGDDEKGEKDAVVVGLAPEQFTYENMNTAFRILLNKSHKLIAIHEAKYYKRGDGLAIGPGCFTKGLEFSSGQKAIVIGKPNPYFFEAAIPESGIDVQECCMIGDDANDDIAGALKVGMMGILVKTGKYINGIETTMEPFHPTLTITNFSEAVDYLIQHNFEI